MSLPTRYNYLKTTHGLPRILVEALRLYGTLEVPGRGNNPTILSWAQEVRVPYSADETAWCGLFIAICAHRAGFEPIDNPLGSRNWARFGQEADVPSLGDVLVFWRGKPSGWQGHVGFYVGQDATHYHVLGGNQSDRVNIMRVAKSRLITARRCAWRVAQPSGVKPYTLTAAGAVSENEA